MKILILAFCSILFGLTACAMVSNDTDDLGPTDPTITSEAEVAVISVDVTGAENQYTFSVTIKSDDKGCDQYANWWEVISEDGDLIYRRILAHSHVNEQPFTRSGNPVKIKENQIVYIRAHMNTTGYGTTVFTGSVKNGFEKMTFAPDFNDKLENTQPLPDGCAF